MREVNSTNLEASELWDLQGSMGSYRGSTGVIYVGLKLYRGSIGVYWVWGFGEIYEGT